MKHITNIIQKIGRPVLLAAAGLALLASTSQAASIKLETKVPGYSNAGWVLVVSENLGGRVIYDNARQCYKTDRVSRGDQIRVTIAATTSTERCKNGAWTGMYSESNYDYFSWQTVSLPFVKTTTVTRNPNNDNVYVWTITTSGFYEKRIPIGTR